MLHNMSGEFPHMPGDMTDRNNDGKFEAEEIDIPSNAHPGICGMRPGFLQTLTAGSQEHADARGVFQGRAQA